MKFFNRSLKVFGDFFLNNGKVYPIVNPVTASVTAKTGNYTVTVSDLDNIFTNTGASGTIVFTIPSVASAKGKCLAVNILAAQIVRLTPQSGEKVNLKGSAVASKYLNIAGVIGNHCDLYCDGVQWIVVSYSGVLTKEA